MRLFLILLLQIAPLFCLYEDQAFKFDWKTALIGIPSGAKFWETSSSSDSAIVFRTESGVLAAVDAESGQIKWRHVFPHPEIALDLAVTEKNVATVTGIVGGRRAHLRIWNPHSGALAHEMDVIVGDEDDENVKFELSTSTFISGSEANLVWMDTDSGSVKIHVFDLKKGSGSEELRSASFTTGAKGDVMECVHTKSVFMCLSKAMRMIYYTSLPVKEKASFAAIPVATVGFPADLKPKRIRAVPGILNYLN